MAYKATYKFFKPFLEMEAYLRRSVPYRTIYEEKN